MDLFTKPPSWSPPTLSFLSEQCDWRNAKVLGVDTETKDPNLLELGPGFIRGESHVLGVSVSIDEANSVYVPLRHYSGNVDNVQAIKWLKSVIESAEIVLFANAHYDMDALLTLGISIPGKVYDVQVIDALIDETHTSYSLENIGVRRLGIGKTSQELHNTLKTLGLKMSNLDKLESSYVAEYAMRDASMLTEIWQSQQADITKYDLKKALIRETKLTKVLWDMHQNGVPIDESKANELNDKWTKTANEYLERARFEVGWNFNPTSSPHLAKVLEQYGYSVPKTEKGNPSVSNDYLSSIDNKTLQLIYEYRRLNKTRSDYVEGVFLKYATNGRIHPQWFQSRNSKSMSEDASGAATGRITGSKPNLTQIPVRSEVGKLCRQIVVAEKGESYCKLDYSSQEPRINLTLAVRAGLPGSKAALKRYLDDKHTDYHSMTKDLILENSGVEVTRFEAKTCNLGLSYGMQEAKLALQLGISAEAARKLLKAYHTGVPYVHPLSQIAQQRAKDVGYIRTLGGRLRHFNKWGSANFGDKELFNSREDCLARYGSAKRAGLHKALNAAVQGSAADQMKESLISVAENIKVPLLQVYDECGVSVDSHEEAKHIVQIMENSMPMEVPALVEPEIGLNWGSTNKI